MGHVQWAPSTLAAFLGPGDQLTVKLSFHCFCSLSIINKLPACNLLCTWTLCFPQFKLVSNTAVSFLLNVNSPQSTISFQQSLKKKPKSGSVKVRRTCPLLTGLSFLLAVTAAMPSVLPRSQARSPSPPHFLLYLPLILTQMSASEYSTEHCTSKHSLPLFPTIYFS